MSKGIRPMPTPRAKIHFERRLVPAAKLGCAIWEPARFPKPETQYPLAFLVVEEAQTGLDDPGESHLFAALASSTEALRDCLQPRLEMSAPQIVTSLAPQWRVCAACRVRAVAFVLTETEATLCSGR